MAPATCDRLVEVDVAVEAVVGAVDADVDDGRARLDPVALDHPVAADGGDEDVGAPADLGQVAGARVADRDRRVGAEQQLGHRLAEEVRAPDDDRLGALQLRAGLLEQQHHARRRARPQPLAPQREQPRADRRQPVDVLARRR